MESMFLAPNWFYNFDIFLEFSFALVALAVCFYAFKIYKLTDEKSTKLYSIGFLFISLSYFIQSGFNVILFLKLNTITNFDFFLNIGVYLYLFLFLLGLMNLSFMTLRTKNFKVYMIFLILVIFAFILSYKQIYFFYAFNSLFLLHISIFYFKKFIEKKKLTRFIVLIGFGFILFSQIHFLFSVNHEIYYVIGHILEAIAYLLILINLLIVTKNGKKTRKIASN